MRGKNKVTNTTHFYEKSALEVSDPLPQAFPCHERKPFECVTHVVWHLWTIGTRKERMNSPDQCSKHIWLYFLLPEQWTSALLVGSLMKSGPCLLLLEPEDTSPRGNLTCYCMERELSPSSLKDFYKFTLPEAVWLVWGPERALQAHWDQFLHCLSKGWV